MNGALGIDADPFPCQVSLELCEVLMASQIGATRHIAALKRGLNGKHGCSPESAWQVHIEGACGEQALAKCLGIYWSGSINTFKHGGDVGCYQVRTRSRHDYELIIRPGDQQDSVFFLVTGLAPNYVVRGWIIGRNGRQDAWWKTHGGREGAWFVPQASLHTDYVPEF